MEFGDEAPQGMGELMREVVDGRMSRGMSDAQRAAAAWHRCNGDRERSHTTGVFLKRPRVPGAAPILGVYVDSHAMATDFGVNKDIYLARLANVGLAVSGIEFVVSRKGYRAAQARRQEAPVEGRPLPELTADERAEVERLVSELPESLRTAASRAISLSKRREKQIPTKPEQNG